MELAALTVSKQYAVSEDPSPEDLWKGPVLFAVGHVRRWQLAIGQPTRQVELAPMMDAVCQMASLKSLKKRGREHRPTLRALRINSPDRAQVSVEPGQGFLNDSVSGRVVVSLVQFQLLVLGRSPQKVKHRF